MSEESRKERMRMEQRASIMRQINTASSSLNGLRKDESLIKKKLKKLEDAIRNIKNHDQKITASKSKLSGITIESSFWQGENATEVNNSYSSLKDAVSTIVKSVSNGLEDLAQKKQELERELEEIQNSITTQTNIIKQLQYSLSTL